MFNLALLPSLTSKDKPALTTSASTGLLLGLFAVVYVSMGLYFATVSTAIGSVMWIILAYQKYQTKA